MRDSMKMTVKYQFGYMLLQKLIAVGIVFLFGAFIFYYFMTINIAKQILSLLLITVEFAILYVASKKLANRDSKPVTPLKPSKVKGVLFGAMIAVINMVLMLMYMIVWSNFAADAVVEDQTVRVLDGIIPICCNAIYYVWSFAYQGFINDYTSGNIGIIAMLLMIIVPIAATTLGYIAGLKKFELAEHLDKFIYEKDARKGEDKE